MQQYIVESYAATAEAFDEACGYAVRVAELGTDVTHVRTIFLPEDETVLHCFDAPSLEALGEAARTVGLRFERMAVAIDRSAGIARHVGARESAGRKGRLHHQEGEDGQADGSSRRVTQAEPRRGFGGARASCSGGSCIW